MSDWLHNLPVVWMALAVFAFTYLTAAIIQVVVSVLAKGERGRAFKAVSPGVLSPLGILFGLFVAFTAAQVWNDTERANTAVTREASALSAVLFLAVSFPGEPQAQMNGLIRRYVAEAASREWPLMAQQHAALPITRNRSPKRSIWRLPRRRATRARKPLSAGSPQRWKRLSRRADSASSSADHRSTRSSGRASSFRRSPPS